jgi:hypothetical protein
MTDAALERPNADPDEGLALAGGEQASDEARIEGIIAQTRSDYPGDDLDEITERLRQRFEQSDVPFDDASLTRYAQQLADSGA